MLLQNLRRNPLRTALTALSFAFPMAVFVAALSLIAALAQFARSNERELRLAVHHKRTVTQSLPAGMRRKIEALDPNHERLIAVCSMRWFGGRVPNTQNVLTSLAADEDTFPLVYADLELSDEEISAWHRQRQAAVVGSGAAATYGWKVGDRVTLESTVPPYLPLEFRIVKVLARGRKNFFYFRRDYLEEALASVGRSEERCHIFWIKCRSAQALHSMQREIDALFANSPDETKSEDENAFAASFMQAAGDLPGLMKMMAVVVVCVLGLVGGNTMMMSFRERIGELAVFKAIGFHARHIIAIVLAESVLLALAGSLLGIVPVTIVLLVAPVRWFGFGPISSLEISPVAVIGSLVIALLVGVAAGLWPAYLALRLRPVDALRKIA